MIDLVKLRENQNVATLMGLQLKANINNNFSKFFIDSPHNIINFFDSPSKKHVEYVIIMEIGEECRIISQIYSLSLFASLLGSLGNTFSFSNLHKDLCNYVAIQINLKDEVETKLTLCRLAGKVSLPKTTEDNGVKTKYMLYYKRAKLRTPAWNYFTSENAYVCINPDTGECVDFSSAKKFITQKSYVYVPLFSLDKGLVEMTEGKNLHKEEYL
jgi:hypothetical protein